MNEAIPEPDHISIPRRVFSVHLIHGLCAMPLTKKGTKIKRAMEKEYGGKKGESVFYASINKGKIKGAHKGKKK
jgi:hypothetical protein